MSAGATLVLGLGNPLLGDDGVGWQVAEQVGRRLASGAGTGPVEVDCAAIAGLSLMERMVGYARAVVVDAISTGRAPIGTVRHLTLEELPDPCAGHTASPHDTSLQTAVRLGRELGAALPAAISIVTIEAEAVREFLDHLSPAVAAAVPPAVDAVLAVLSESP